MKTEITISQTKYIETILKIHNMEYSNPVKTPLDLNIKLEKNPEGIDGDQNNSYALLIGSLQYLATATWPDIAFAVNRLAAYTANPSMMHWTATKCILHYLAGTKKYGITYYSSETNSIDKNLIHSYADAAFANNENSHSTIGYVFKSFGGAITWGSRKQNLIAHSSMEAEYIALSEAA